VPAGVYRGSTPDISRIEAYEAFLGMPAGTTVGFVLAFMADAPSWPDFERGALQSHTNGPAGPHSAAEWAPLLAGRQLVLGVPACVQGTTWAQEAAGANDAHWRALAAALTAGGLGGCVLRIARELQGFPWKVTAATAGDHKAGWQRIVSTMRAAGFTGKFMWNPYIGPFKPPGEVVNAYPGNATVDVIGIDLYDGGYPLIGQGGDFIRTPAQQQAVWNNFRDQWDGLEGYRNWAASIGRPLAYPEWGLGLWNSGGNYGGGGDNPILINEMAAWMKDTRPFMHAFWEDAGMGVSDPDAHPARQVAVPASRAAFLAAFGYTA
jgi:hypothetical protein